MNEFQLNEKKIDCHTHIVSKKIRDEYFGKTSGYALVMQFPDSIMKNEECLETVESDNRLFLNPCVDLQHEIPPQLNAIRKILQSHRVVGLKIYLSYQSARACDKRLYPIYEFAAKNGLSVTFHTGLCSLVLPSDNDIDGSAAKYVEKAAIDFPQVNFIIAHMDDPRFEECIRIVSAHDNLFTDFSGAYETGTKEGSDVDGAVAVFGAAIKSQSGTEHKILYGTDFCPPINLSQLDEYDYSIEKIFQREHFPLIYYKNCLRAFPKLKNYINESDF